MAFWSCTLSGCAAFVPLDVDGTHLCAHLLEHGYQLGRHLTSCGCIGCLCPKQGPNGTQCAGRAPGHAWHGTNMVKHVVQQHLNFEDVCPKCGNGGFANTYSYNRHVYQCPGRTLARCRVCLVEFPSIVALGGHRELGLCMGGPTLAVGGFD
jgi:hypothetical protein